MILGLLARAGHGKSTAARYLHDERGFAIQSLAGPLKACAKAVMGFSDAQLYGSQADKEAIDPRYGMSARTFLQRLGTDGLRAHFGGDVHVRALLRGLDPSVSHVIDDVRFPDEVDAINAAGGRVIKIICADVPRPRDEHSSEWSIDLVPRSAIHAVVISARSMGVKHLYREIDTAIGGPIAQQGR